MILDENLVVKISPINISHNGEKIDVTKMVFKHPTPGMAKATFKMRTYFVKMGKESEKAVLGNMSKEAAEVMVSLAMQEKEKMQAGSEVNALHKDYADGDEESREAKLQKIDEMEKSFTVMSDSCESVDFFAMTNDFGKMILDNKRCSLQCNADDAPEVLEPLTGNIWGDMIDPVDRLAAAIKYCCFFGLTSNTRK